MLQDWNYRAVYKNDVIEATLFTIQSMNQIIKIAADLCTELSLKQIISAEVLAKGKNQFYKIQFITRPNNGIYESMLINEYVEKYEFKSEKYSIFSRNDISRIDSYGEQPKCISNFEKNPAELLDIRKFCFCIKRKFYSNSRRRKIYFNNKLIIS